MPTKKKVCPMLKNDCLERQCAWYYPNCKTCSLQSLPFNTFKLAKLIEEGIDVISDNQTVE